MDKNYIIDLSKLRSGDINEVGGKNALLGELIGTLTEEGIKVPDGFAITTAAYHYFLAENELDKKIAQTLLTIQANDLDSLSRAAKQIRSWITKAPLPADLKAKISAAYLRLADGSDDIDNIAVAVRSSATTEDMPDSSFAGQQDTYLNISGAEAVIDAVRLVFASLFTDRVISYRHHRGYDHADIAMSVTIQRLIRSDLATSGVIFTLDTESGFNDAILITSAYGLGEHIVKGNVDPDEFYIYKPALAKNKSAIIRRRIGNQTDKMVFSDQAITGRSLRIVPVAKAQRDKFSISDKEVLILGRYASQIEHHYGKPMDIEWAKDGLDGQLYIVQVRPETVQSKTTKEHTFVNYHIKSKGRQIASGRAIGQKIGCSTARLIKNIKAAHAFLDGDILLTDMTDPSWEPVMKRASAIIIRRGGRTCHAAIVARELGVPAVVGCDDSIDAIKNNTQISVSCAEGDTGFVYEGDIIYTTEKIAISNDKLPIKLQVNIANPDTAFNFAKLPVDGVGLARLEFIIARSIGFHPRCALDYKTLSEPLKRQVKYLARGYKSPREFYISKIVEGISTIAAAFAPRIVIVRLSDFKSNEYANLIGGKQFEPIEENPMLGFRGASRYISAVFSECLQMECEAILRIRRDIGLNNIWLMVPFVRTLAEADSVIAILKKYGISRKQFKIIMMCEIPANALLADAFLQRFDGFSIGSNDLTQLTLALDRDSSQVAASFDERNQAVKALISLAINACCRQNKYIGICGEGPSDHHNFAKWLLKQGISAISLSPDAVHKTRLQLIKDLAELDS